MSDRLGPADPVESRPRPPTAAVKPSEAPPHHDHVLDAMVENLAFAGGIADIDKQTEKLRRFEAAGLGAIALRLYADPAESIRLIGERIVPALV